MVDIINTDFDIRLFHLFFQCKIFFCIGAFDFKLLDSGRQFLNDIVDAVQVVFRLPEPFHRFFFALLILHHTGNFLNQHSSLIRTCFQKRLHFTLGNDVVCIFTEPGIQEQFSNFFQACTVIIDEILTVAVSVQFSHDVHFIRLHRQRTVLIVQLQLDFRCVHRCS